MPVRLVEAIREFTRTISGPYDLEILLDAVIGHTMAVLDVTGAGILLENREGHLQFAAASEERVKVAEQLQDRVEEGVCFEAFKSDTPVVVPDLTSETRWTAYTPRVLELGFRGLMGIPMRAGGETIGALNIYADEPTAWSDGDVDAAEVLAAMGAAYVWNASRLRASMTLAEQLQHALDARVVIEQAKGFLCATYDLEPEGAHALMRRHARQTGRRLAHVAADVLDGSAPLRP